MSAGRAASARSALEVSARRRPKDRKQRILEHAARLFIERGFHSVRLEDIADEAGVTARALYRHYDNKQSLLAAVILTSQETYQAIRRASGAATTNETCTLQDELPDLIDAAIATRQLTVLWQRESRYLDDAERRHVRSRINAIVGGIDAAVGRELPDLSPRHAHLRAWAVSSTLTSLGFHQQGLAGDGLPRLLHRACTAAARTPPVAELLPLGGGTVARPQLRSRRESLLGAGARLFRARGYPAVSTGDIGREAGIAGSGIYRTFASKQAILDELVRRLDQWRTLECVRAMRAGGGPDETLRMLAEGHARLSVEDPDLVAVTVTELAHVSPDVLDAHSRGQADREAEWLDRITATTPATRAQARLLIAAATSFIDDVARTPRLARQSGIHQEIAAIAHVILTSTE